MKKIETVISARAFQTIRDLLIAQRRDIVVSEVSAEHDGGRPLLYRGVAYHGYESRLKIETLVSDSDAMPVVHAILSASRALDSPDHTVAVSPVENVLSIGITKLQNQPGAAAPAIVKKARAPLPELSRYARAV